MPGFEPHAGSPDVERDARGDHDLLFGADEEGEILRTLAPGIFSARGGAGPITSTYGQFVSIMYEALIIGAVYKLKRGNYSNYSGIQAILNSWRTSTIQDLNSRLV